MRESLDRNILVEVHLATSGLNAFLLGLSERLNVAIHGILSKSVSSGKYIPLQRRTKTIATLGGVIFNDVDFRNDSS